MIYSVCSISTKNTNENNNLNGKVKPSPSPYSQWQYEWVGGDKYNINQFVCLCTGNK